MRQREEKRSEKLFYIYVFIKLNIEKKIDCQQVKIIISINEESPNLLFLERERKRDINNQHTHYRLIY